MRSSSGLWLVVIAAIILFVPYALQPLHRQAGQSAFSVSAAVAPEATKAATPGGEPGSKAQPLLNPCTGKPFTTLLTSTDVESASIAPDPTGTKDKVVVNLVLKDNLATQAFSAFTAKNIGQPIAIVLDGKVVMAPVVQAEIKREVQIAGIFTKWDAAEFVADLTSGALPLPITLVEQNDIEGGLRLVLQVGNGGPVTPAQMEETRDKLAKRIKAMGIESPDVAFPDSSMASNNQVYITLPGTMDQDNIEAASRAVQSTGLLEFVDFSKAGSCQAQMPFQGQYVLTDVQLERSQPNAPPLSTPQATSTR